MAAKFNWDRVARESRMWGASGDPMPSGGHAYDRDMQETDPRRKERRPEPARPGERAEARRLGLSVEQLRAMRARQTEALLRAEARRRGIKTKTFRKMIARGEAQHPMSRIRKTASKAASEAGPVASRTKRLGGTGVAVAQAPVLRKKRRKPPDRRPDGRVAVALTRLDCIAILEHLAGKPGLPDSTARRLGTPLLSRAARRRAVSSARRDGAAGSGHSDVALVYVDGRYDELVAAMREESNKEFLVDIVRDAAVTFRKPRQ